jgi:hypothetical protein
MQDIYTFESILLCIRNRRLPEATSGSVELGGVEDPGGFPVLDALAEAPSA